MPFSLRQRREFMAREFLSISIRPLSDGRWIAVLVESATPDDIERYTSTPQDTTAEALCLADYELDALVEKRVDQIEADERDEDVRQVECKSTLPRAFGGF